MNVISRHKRDGDIARKHYFGLLVAAVVFGLTGGEVWATTITKWDFGVIGLQPTPFNSPLPSTGTGTAVTLGMTNAYNGGNTASDDVVATSGTANPAFTENTWRIRGTAHNGWATHAAGAPQYSQGLELDASTVGFSNVHFVFDWYSTTQGIRDLQFQYNTNISNPAGWTNFGGTSPTGTYIAASNDFYNAPGSPTINIDLSSIPGVNNDPAFGLRLVSAYDSTGNVPNDYASAALIAGLTQIYNNSSGNWRFDNLGISGTAVPEPASMILMGLAVAGLACANWRRAISK